MKTRFVTSIVKSAQANADAASALPWTRGTRRAAFIAKRAEVAPARKTA